MKKILSLALLAALSATLLQCTKETNDENPEAPAKKTLISFTVEGETKVSCEQKGMTLYLNSWEKDDRVYVYTSHAYHGFLTNGGGGTNKFTGELSNLPESEDEIIFIHFGKEVTVNEDGSADVSLISEQYGKLTGEHSIMNNITLWSDGYDYSPGTTEFKGSLWFDQVILKLDIASIKPYDGNYITLTGQRYNSFSWYYNDDNGWNWYGENISDNCKLYNPSEEYYLLLSENNYYRKELTFQGSDKSITVNCSVYNGFKTGDSNGAAAIISDIPVVHTTDVCAIYANTASAGGHITTVGLNKKGLTGEGICWGEDKNPTISDNHTERYSYKNSIGYFTGFMSGLTAGKTYHVRAYVTTGTEAGGDLEVSYGEDKTFTTLSESETPHYEYVNLGLPSGVCWATFNLGATKPEELGDYYMWGDVACCNNTYTFCMWYYYPYDIYRPYIGAEERSYKFYSEDPDDSNPTKYDTVNPDGTRSLEDEDDAAYQNWGENWYIPSKNDVEELFANTTCERVEISGIKGYQYTSTVEGFTNKSIFFPSDPYKTEYPDGGIIWKNAANITSTSDGSDTMHGYGWSTSGEIYGDYKERRGLIRPIFIPTNP